jgi:hypothetical protein
MVLSLVLIPASAQTTAAAGLPASLPNADCTPTVTAGPGGDTWVPLEEQSLTWLCNYFGPLNASVEVSVVPDNPAGPLTFATVAALGPGGGSTGPLTNCNLLMEEVLANESDASDRLATSANLVFHCYEAKMMGLVAYGSVDPSMSWLTEGSAEWVGECYVGDCQTQGSERSSVWWDTYLSKPETPLFQRSADAIGFFAHMQEGGISPFDRLPAMLTAGGLASAFAAAQGDDHFLETWAGGYAREAAWDPHLWDTTGPGITTTRPPGITTPQDLENGTTQTGIAAAYSNFIQLFELNADVVIISVDSDGHGQLHAADGTTLNGSAVSDNFCMLASGCVLPSASCPPTTPLATGDAVLAVNGGTAGSEFSIAGMSLADFCTKIPPTPSASPPPPPYVKSCSVHLAPTAHEIVTNPSVTTIVEPAECAGSVQGNLAVEVFTHPGQAGALLSIAMQHVGAPPMTCQDLLVGSSQPFRGVPPPLPASVVSAGAVAGLECVRMDQQGVPGHIFTSTVQVFWFSSDTQAQQFNADFQQHLGD